MAAITPGLGASLSTGGPDALSGALESILDRRQLTSVGFSSGQLRFTHFTAQKSGTVNSLRVYTGSTAAAATPTLCRLGLYAYDDASATYTFLGATANDTTLFAAAGTQYTKALTASVNKVAGQRYALGLLVVSATTMPNLLGIPTGGSQDSTDGVPRLSANWAGQTDLPTGSFSAGPGWAGASFYCVLM